MLYGVLGEPTQGQLGPLVQAGVRTAELVIDWSRYEPQDGVFDSAYIAGRQALLRAMVGAGIKPTLSFSHHYSPAWVCGLPGAQFVDQGGATSCPRPVNMVFSQTIRGRILRAIQHIAQDFGPASDYAAVRVQNGGNAGEISYPGGGHYWGFDANASGGADLPASVPSRPFPAWRPGQTTISTTQVRQWLDWYLGALADAQDMQIAEYQRLGFSGPFILVMPGLGVKPSAVQSEVNAYLAGGNPWLGQGVAWYDLVGKVGYRAASVAYTSSLAEIGSARDACQASDAQTSPTSATVGDMGVGRYMAWIGAQYGMPIGGENPGCCDGYNLALMDATFDVARSCGYRSVYWAHVSNLFDGTAGDGLELDDYARRISANP